MPPPADPHRERDGATVLDMVADLVQDPEDVIPFLRVLDSEKGRRAKFGEGEVHEGRRSSTSVTAWTNAAGSSSDMIAS